MWRREETSLRKVMCKARPIKEDGREAKMMPDSEGRTGRWTGKGIVSFWGKCEGGEGVCV